MTFCLVNYSDGNWNLKLMRDNLLGASEVPDTYTINGTTYTISAGTNGQVHWNNPKTLKSTNYNDWTTAGLQYFLNTTKDSNGVAGYYSTFSDEAKALIDENYKYNLGNVYYRTTVNRVHRAERQQKVCSSSLSADSNLNSCWVWYGNKASWNGAIALLYPTDYAYAADSSYWETTNVYDYNSAESSNWMQQTANHTTSPEVFLSPSALVTSSIMYWATTGRIFNSPTWEYLLAKARPTLNLISKTLVDINHEGSKNDPYIIIE